MRILIREGEILIDLAGQLEGKVLSGVMIATCAAASCPVQTR